jgi:regulator of protease activity HflC (stomatin/prohibitin superfamily)
MYSVEGGHRAVIFNRVVGMKDMVYGEGLNFNIPWLERPIVFDIRTRPVNLQTLTGSKDLQMVTLGIRVLHKPDPSQLVWIYRFLGVKYDERVLPSIMNECAKAVVARYNASELLTQRELVSREITAELRKRALNFNILLEVSRVCGGMLQEAPCSCPSPASVFSPNSPYPPVVGCGDYPFSLFT